MNKDIEKLKEQLASIIVQEIATSKKRLDDLRGSWREIQLRIIEQEETLVKLEEDLKNYQPEAED